MRNRAWVVGLVAGLVLAGHAMADEWDAGGDAKWQATLAAAKQEGGVVASICDTLTAPIARDFKADTGLDITFVPGSLIDQSNRYRAELKSGHVTIDVRMSGASDVDLGKSGYLQDLNTVLVLPQVIDKTKWSGGDFDWVDNDHKYLFNAAEYVSTRPLINTDIIDPASIKTWSDLMKPEFKGKIAVSDPTVFGSGQTFGAYLAHIRGLDFVISLLRDQQAVFSRDSRQLGEWAARGVYPIVLGMDALYLDRFREEGITSLDWVTPTDGPGSLVGGCATVSLPKGSPHPNAAAVFLNWYLSRRGQMALEEAGHYPSLRNDIPHDHVSAHFIPTPGLVYLKQYKEDWYLNELASVRSALKTALQDLVGN